MGCRSRIAAVVCLLVLAGASTASAAKIDPGLQEILDRRDKAEDEIIPVLMVFPEQPQLDDLEVMMDGTTPSKRRKSVIAALKRRARKAQAEVWELLEDPDHPGVLQDASLLYFANAIAFSGDREVILAVAEANNDKALDDAILFHDKDYELVNALPAAGAGDKVSIRDIAWNVEHLQAPRVWNELGFTGEGIVIGHIDTGVDYHHRDLKGRLAVNAGEIPGNGIDDDENGYVDDVHGWDFGDHDADPMDDTAVASHGTHTAGSAVGDGTGGMRTGVAPGAQLLPVKIFDAAGHATLGRIWKAQQYCVENGARIITMSLGVKGEIPVPYLRNDRFSADALRVAGVVVFNSAGNYREEFNPPVELGMTARIPAPWCEAGVPYSSTSGVITVGGTGSPDDEAYEAGSRGPTTWAEVDPWYDWPLNTDGWLIKPDVVAPAAGIASTLPGDSYSGETWSGTSMSCPQVAGVAALMLEKNPTLSAAGIDSVLQQSAVDLGEAGKDNVFGAGLVDAYAAVQAVPTEQLPNLNNVAYLPDPLGNATVDPGEQVPLVFEVDNAGLVPATGVIGHLTVDANPFVAAQDALVAFPDAPADARVSNADSPFTVIVSPEAPQGYVFRMNLTLSTAEGFERIFDLKGFVGLPELRTHDELGNLFLTITARGSLGYLDDTQTTGYGLGLRGGPSSLFLGSLWAGNGAGNICNNDFTAGGDDPAEWRPRLEPNGNVRVIAGDADEQVFGMAFTDAGAVAPRGVEVDLLSRSFGDPAREDALILDYIITNTGDGTIDGYHAGLFVDWDVIDALGNVGGVDGETRSVWVGMPHGPVFGMALLPGVPVSNATLVDNPLYVYPENHVTAQHKQQLLDGSIHQSSVVAPTDLSALLAAGPFTLGPGDQVRLSFVVAYGDDVDDFLASVTAAATGHATPVPDDGRPVRPLLALGQNHPNPFNPSTIIDFTLPAPGPVHLEVFDVTGRHVRTLVHDQLVAGAHAVRWNGRDDGGQRAASGMYFYKLETGQETLTRKMLLVK